MGGASFRNTLNANIARILLQQQGATAYPCSDISLGTSFVINRIAVKGTQVVVGSAIGLFVSHDSGETFNIPQSTSSGFILPPISAGSIDIVDSEIYVAATDPDTAGVKTVPITGGTCQINVVPGGLGLLVSRDGGQSFVSLPAGGVRSIAAYRSRKNSNQIFNIGSSNTTDPSGRYYSGLMVSNDSGESFTPSSQSPVLSTFHGNLEMNTILETSLSVFSMAQKSYSTTFFKSQNQVQVFFYTAAHKFGDIVVI